jgi:hypothetical protein
MELGRSGAPGVDLRHTCPKGAQRRTACGSGALSSLTSRSPHQVRYWERDESVNERLYAPTRQPILRGKGRHLPGRRLPFGAAAGAARPIGLVTFPKHSPFKGIVRHRTSNSCPYLDDCPKGLYTRSALRYRYDHGGAPSTAHKKGAGPEARAGEHESVRAGAEYYSCPAGFSAASV